MINANLRYQNSGIYGAGPGLWYGNLTPDATFGDWYRAPLGSIYVRVDASGASTDIWQKIANTGTATDWKMVHGDGDGATARKIADRVGRQKVLVANDKHNAFPGICRAANGDLLIVYREANRHYLLGDLGKIYLSRSVDDGQTWADPVVVIESGTFDYRDPSIMLCASGRLVMSLFTYPADSVLSVARSIYSDDNGATWSAPVSLIPTMYRSHCSSPVIELDGKLYQGVYGYVLEADTYFTCRIAMSDDEGETWTDYAEIVDGADLTRDCTEPNLVLASSTEMLAFVRINGKPESATNSDIVIYTSNAPFTTWTYSGASFVGTGSPHVTKTASNRYLVNYRSIDALRSQSSAGYLAQRLSAVSNYTVWGDERIAAMRGNWRTTQYASTIELFPQTAPGIFATTLSEAYDRPSSSAPYAANMMFLYQSETELDTEPTVHASGVISRGDMTIRNGRISLGLLPSEGVASLAPARGASVYLTENGANYELRVRFPGGTDVKLAEGVVSSNGLQSNLVAYWALREAGGANNALDLHVNGLHLTQYGSPGSAAGKLYAGARTFNGSTNYFTRSSTGFLQAGGQDYTFAIWVYIGALPLASPLYLVTKDNASSSREYLIAIGTDGKAIHSNSGGGYVAAVTDSAAIENSWNLVMAWRDNALEKLYVSLNNGTAAEASKAAWSSTAQPFYLGRYNTAYSAIPRLGSVVLWKSAEGGGGALTEELRDAVWNDGEGLTYAGIMA